MGWEEFNTLTTNTIASLNVNMLQVIMARCQGTFEDCTNVRVGTRHDFEKRVLARHAMRITEPTDQEIIVIVDDSDEEDSNIDKKK